MFFPMLRRQAKWVFVLLALVFAGGFVFFGVGSGQGGLGDVLQGWLGTGGSAGGPSISKLEAQTRENPKDATAWHELGTAYAGDQKTDQAIAALQRYTALRPKDPDGLQELAAQYERKLQDISAEATGDPLLTAAAADRSSFVPPSTTPLGQAYTDTNALGDPVDSAVQSLASQRQTEYQQRLVEAGQKKADVYKRLVEVDPTDPATQFQLAQAAQYVGDTATAIAAYKQAKKLDPQSYGAYADQALKVLEPAPAPKK
jgi:cytochrome c-type biogenesis protein CcmH/NrfG